MTIRENVPAEEADALVAEGGRVLYRRPSPSGEGVVCDVEMPEGAPKAAAKPKKAKMTERAEDDEPADE